MTATSVNADTRELARHLAIAERKATAPIPPLERCDRCHTSQAKARVTVTTGQIYLCGHHIREHIHALNADPNAIVHVDSMDVITEHA